MNDYDQKLFNDNHITTKKRHMTLSLNFNYLWFDLMVNIIHSSDHSLIIKIISASYICMCVHLFICFY